MGSVAHRGLFRRWNQITPRSPVKTNRTCITSLQMHSLFLFLIVSQKLVLLLENRSEIQMLISRWFPKIPCVYHVCLSHCHGLRTPTFTVLSTPSSYITDEHTESHGKKKKKKMDLKKTQICHWDELGKHCSATFVIL